MLSGPVAVTLLAAEDGGMFLRQSGEIKTWEIDSKAHAIPQTLAEEAAADGTLLSKYNYALS